MDVPQPVALPVTPPQPVNGHLPIEDWLQQRLVSQFNPVHHAPFEYSLYGVMNALLSTQFPLSRKFMVKPQALLWATIESLQLGPDEVNTSGGTAGTDVPIFPDFVVVRAHEQLFNDWILCIVELKREGEDRYRAEDQLMRYLERARNERWRVGILWGFLIVGNHCYAYHIDTTQPNSDIERDVSFDLGATHGVAFKQALFSIARKYWGDSNAGWMTNNFVGPYE